MRRPFGGEPQGKIVTGLEALWPIVLALAFVLLGMLLLAAGLVVPLALAVLKAAFVGWAARAVLERLDAGKREPSREGPDTPSPPPPQKPQERPHEPLRARPTKEGRT